MKRFIFLVVIIMCVALTGCQAIEKEEKIDVNATVTDIEYQSSDGTMMPIFNGETTILIPQTLPARYLVTISYEDVSKTFNDRNLYENVKEGDTTTKTKQLDFKRARSCWHFIHAFSPFCYLLYQLPKFNYES